jgi:flagellar hook protein FlgE
MSLLGTLTSSVSALDSFTTGLDTIGNNISNINTTAFKGSSVSFADTFSGLGTQVASVSTSFSQGALSSTGNTTDLGISGNGYFIVQDPANAGTYYATRDGQFSFNSAGFLVNQQGYEVMGLTGGTGGASPTAPATLGPIKQGTPPASTALQSVSIDASGNVIESYSDGSSATTNQILLDSFTNQAALTNVGNNLYSNLSGAGAVVAPASMAAATNAPGSSGLGTVHAGTLEQSNVDLTQQFSDMITMQRAFEANARLVTISDTILEDVVNMKTH